MTRVKLSDNLSEDMWPTLKQYILEVNPASDDQIRTCAIIASLASGKINCLHVMSSMG